ncbi:hypothetical protein ACVMIH_007488 [Bradyrhizobium sp. USDA 4503]
MLALKDNPPPFFTDAEIACESLSASLRRVRPCSELKQAAIVVDGLGVRSPDGVAYRYTFIVDPDNTIQHVYATNLNVGRVPKDTLRVLDALQTDELCPCNREVGGETLKVA